MILETDEKDKVVNRNGREKQPKMINECYHLLSCVMHGTSSLKKPLLVAEKSKRKNPLHDIYLAIRI